VSRPRRIQVSGVVSSVPNLLISPILADLFLHYTFDLWMKRTYPNLLWCRYADDGLVHCRTEQEAKALKADLQARLAECRLELHPVKNPDRLL
jgi:RNA-directed DNA polymerase